MRDAQSALIEDGENTIIRESIKAPHLRKKELFKMKEFKNTGKNKFYII